MELFGGDGKKYSTEKENSTGRCHLFCVSNNTGIHFLMNTVLIFFFVAGSMYVICMWTMSNAAIISILMSVAVYI